MRAARPLTLLVLAAWVLLGPIAMAFDDCGMCDEGCVLSTLTRSLETTSAPPRVADLALLPADPVLPGAPKTPEPPPKSLRSA